MPIRLRIEIRSRGSDRRVVLTALVNTGFMSEEPDILIPVNLARDLTSGLNQMGPY